MTVHKWSQTAASNDTADGTINLREGMAPSQLNDSNRAMMAAIAKWRDDTSGLLETGGTSTAYTVATNQAFSTLTNGLTLCIRAHATNGATPTLNVDSLGAKPLRALTGIALGDGYMIAGTPYKVSYFSAADEWLLHDAPLQHYVVPLGGLIDFAGSTAPSSNFAFPYGQAISRTTYAGLYAVIGTTYGSGDGSTTFNLPDLRGRVVVGKDNMGGTAASRMTSTTLSPNATTLGATGGAQTVTIAKANLPDYNLSHTLETVTTGTHSHDITILRGTVEGGTGSATALMAPSSSYSTGSTTETTQNDGAHNHGITGSIALGGSGTALDKVQPSMVLNKLMRVL